VIDPGTCNIYLPQGDDPERTNYLTIQYRTNHFDIRNETTDHWMYLSNFVGISRDGKSFNLDTTQNMTTGDVPWAGGRLAPGQCVIYSELDVNSLPPFDCTVVGYIRLTKGASFWLNGFTAGNTFNGRRAICPAPRPGLLTICVVPRDIPVR
jgi:hypothetical protein